MLYTPHFHMLHHMLHTFPHGTLHVTLLNVSDSAWESCYLIYSNLRQCFTDDYSGINMSSIVAKTVQPLILNRIQNGLDN